MQETISILVQQYSKDPANYIFCKVISGSPTNFRLRKEYVSKFSTKLTIGKAFIVTYAERPSDCGQFTNISVSPLAELSEEQKVKLLLGL